MSTDAMRRAGTAPLRITQTSAAWLYWTVAQMVAHHTSNGCNLAVGDLVGSGTASGPDKSALGCLLELTLRGSEPLTMPSGEKRGFIEDGDEIIFRGFCAKPGYPRIGLWRMPRDGTAGGLKMGHDPEKQQPVFEKTMLRRNAAPYSAGTHFCRRFPVSTSPV